MADAESSIDRAGTRLDKFHAHHFVGLFNLAVEETWRYGPQWQQAWTSLWSVYDELESARVASSTPRRKWQDGYEDYRWGTELQKSKTYTPLDSNVSSSEKGKWPLCAALWEFEGTSLQQGRTQPWKTTLESWVRFQELYRDADSGFREMLSVEQRMSFHVLNDWWMCHYAPAEDVADVRTKLEGGDLDRLGFAYKESFFRPRIKWKSHSAYHSALLELFLREFHPMSWEPFERGISITVLELNRPEAVTMATRQRFARSIWDVWRMRKGEAPRALADALFLRKYPQTIPTEYDAWGKDTVTVSLVPPTYLWDIKGRKTIQVLTLSSCPRYACISHTWGRWRLSNSLDANVPVTGVPWNVPPNKLYDVQELPDMLSRLQMTDIQYVWFDLFCIPQDASEPAVTQREIANQASIFRGSSRALVWLHNVENWQAVEDVLMYLAVSYLRTKCATDPYEHVFPDHMFENTRKLANCLVPLWDLDSGEPCGWFSSLWTLQEAMLCPNLELCSRDMEVLVDGRGVPITLAAMLNLSTNSEAVNPGEPFIPISTTGTDPLADIKPPTGLEQLHWLNEYTGLGVLLKRASPISLFSLSGSRESSDSRAPAIMAALNVTDWYRAGGPGAAQEELVLNCFPLAFVREAARKYGAKFFYTLGFFPWDSMVKEVRQDGFLAPRGTMLPFSAYEQIDTTGQRRSFDQGDGSMTRSHEAVQGWEILVDGSVRIRSAAILASSAPEEDASDPPAPRRLMVAQLAADLGPGYRTVDLSGRYDDLEEGLIKFAGAFFELGAVVYAVQLFDDAVGLSFGVLLLELGVTNARADARAHLIKVGTFWLKERVQNPPSTAVDWIVL